MVKQKGINIFYNTLGIFDFDFVQQDMTSNKTWGQGIVVYIPSKAS